MVAIKACSPKNSVQYEGSQEMLVLLSIKTGIKKKTAKSAYQHTPNNHLLTSYYCLFNTYKHQNYLWTICYPGIPLGRAPASSFYAKLTVS